MPRGLAEVCFERVTTEDMAAGRLRPDCGAGCSAGH